VRVACVVKANVVNFDIGDFSPIYPYETHLQNEQLSHIDMNIRRSHNAWQFCRGTPVELRTLVVPLLCILLFCIGATIAAPAQTFTVLSDFNGPNGECPFAPLVQASDDNFYGTATYGGSLATHIAISPRNCYVGCGTIFKMTPAGRMKLLYQFYPQPAVRTARIR
jgi:hypothetical protein